MDESSPDKASASCTGFECHWVGFVIQAGSATLCSRPWKPSHLDGSIRLGLVGPGGSTGLGRPGHSAPASVGQAKRPRDRPRPARRWGTVSGAGRGDHATDLGRDGPVRRVQPVVQAARGRPRHGRAWRVSGTDLSVDGHPKRALERWHAAHDPDPRHHFASAVIRGRKPAARPRTNRESMGLFLALRRFEYSGDGGRGSMSTQ